MRNKNRAITRLATTAAVWGLCVVPTLGVDLYSITDLGTLPGGTLSVAFDINASGHVVGYSETETGDWHAFLWDGVMHDVGTLGGAMGLGIGINNAGEASGLSLDATGSAQGFFCDGTAMSGLYTPFGGSEAYRLNGAGIVAGGAENAGGAREACFWESNVIRYIGSLDGPESCAWDVNDALQIVGWSQVSTNDRHAFLWDVVNGMTDLSTLGGPYSEALNINNAGQVIGGSDIGGDISHAFLYSGGVMTDLGTLPGALHSWATGLNENAQVVGWSGDVRVDGPPPWAGDAFLWDGGQMYNLNDLLVGGSAWDLEGAGGINDAGQIVGWGQINGETHGFLMTPVPEPAALALLVIGMVAARRRH